VNTEGGDGTGCLQIKEWVDTTKFKFMRIAAFGNSGILVREGEMFVKDET